MYANASIDASNTTLAFAGLSTGCTSGSDYSSVISQLGSALTSRNQILTSMVQILYISRSVWQGSKNYEHAV